MQEEFRIKEGGRGNVVSDAQNGGLTLTRLNGRNPAVAGTPFSRDYLVPLVVLLNNKYYEQLSELLEEWQKKTNNLDDFYAFADEAIALFNSPTPAIFVIIYARALMLHQTLLHKMQKPLISADDKGSYSGSSGAILVGNGGTIGNGCVFHHAVSWQYIVQQLDFNPRWSAKYNGCTVDEGYGVLESQCDPYDNGVSRYFIGFAPFGKIDPAREDAITIGELSYQTQAQVDIRQLWSTNYTGKKFVQARYGLSSTRLSTAPFKYNLYNDYIRYTEIANNSIIRELPLDYTPIFLARTSGQLEREKTLTYGEKTQQGDDKHIFVASVESVFSLEDLQRASHLKMPFFRSTSKERLTGSSDEETMPTPQIRQWVSDNLVPPHMSDTEWWEKFYTERGRWNSTKECGEYSNGTTDEIIGVVFASNDSFRLVEWGSVNAKSLPNPEYAGASMVFRSTESANDETVYTSSAVEPKNSDQIGINCEMFYKVMFQPRIKIRIAMSIGDGWMMLPEDAVRASLKQYTNIDCIYTDVDASEFTLEVNGKYYPIIGTSNGGSIDISAILQNENIDFDNKPLDELIDSLKAGFIGTLWRNTYTTGTYCGINGKPVNLINNWRDK